MKIKQWYIYTANLNPQLGTEAGKVRPVLVIQSDLLNSIHPSTIILPITTNIILNAEPLRYNLKPAESGLKKESAILIDQVRAIDNQRFVKEIGKINPAQIKKIKQSLMEVLDWI
jgi:mRNA interferase MazF